MHTICIMYNIIIINFFFGSFKSGFFISKKCINLRAKNLPDNSDFILKS